jgi:lipopolysaccharide assembly protein A
MRNAKLIAAVSLTLLVIIWVLQNRGAVTTRFLWITVSMPQAVLLAITLLAGFAIGLLFALRPGGRGGKRSGLR